MRSIFAKLALHRFMNGGSDLHCITTIVDQSAFVLAEGDNDDKAAPNGGGVVQEKPAEIVEDDD